MFSRFLIALIMAFGLVTQAAEQIKISALPRTNSIADGDLILVARITGGQSNTLAITKGNLLSGLGSSGTSYSFDTSQFALISGTNVCIISGAALTNLIVKGSLSSPGPVYAGGLVITNGVTNLVLTASRAMVSDANKGVVSSAVTATELGYLSGVTSALQTQLAALASTANLNSASNSLQTQISAAATTAQLNSASNVLQIATSNNVAVAAGAGISVASAGSGGRQTYTVTSTGGTNLNFSTSQFALSNGTNVFIIDGVSLTNLLAKGTLSSLGPIYASGLITTNGHTNLALTASRAMVSDANKGVVSSAVTATELTLLSGLTGSLATTANLTSASNALQTQVSALPTTAQLTSASNVLQIATSNNVVVAAGTGIGVTPSGSGGRQTYTVALTGSSALSTNLTNLTAYTGASNAVPLITIGAVGQNTNLFEVKNSSGTILWYINSAGETVSMGTNAGRSIWTATNGNWVERGVHKDNASNSVWLESTNGAGGLTSGLLGFTNATGITNQQKPIAIGSGLSLSADGSTLSATAGSGNAGDSITNVFRYVATTNVTSITTPNFPTTYNRIKFHIYGRDTNTTTLQAATLRVNGNAGNIYYRQSVSGNGATTTSAFTTNSTAVTIGVFVNTNGFPTMAQMCDYEIPEYSNALWGKVGSGHFSYAGNPSVPNVQRTMQSLFLDTAEPITNLTFSSTGAWMTGTVFSVTLMK